MMSHPDTSERVLVTGATGFIGSSLSARLLTEGKQVLALTRRDPDGAKTRGAIKRAAQALGLRLPPSHLEQNLRVITTDLTQVAESVSASDLSKVTQAWNLAALLSYDPRRIAESVDLNIAAACDLYELLCTKAPSCRRFYQVSTAYTVGLPRAAERIPEELHYSPHSPNVYQLSKWGAEMALRNLSFNRQLPVTLLRPAVVVGHSRTGAYHGDPFGIYMFLLAGHRLVTSRGIRELHLPSDLDGSVSLVPIDALVENCVGLGAREGMTRAPFEVIHCTGSLVAAATVVRVVRQVLGVEVTFDGPNSELDRQFSEAVRDNQVFAAHAFHFEEARLAAILGSARVEVPVDEAVLTRLLSRYMQGLSGVTAGPAAPHYPGAHPPT